MPISDFDSISARSSSVLILKKSILVHYSLAPRVSVRSSIACVLSYFNLKIHKKIKEGLKSNSGLMQKDCRPVTVNTIPCENLICCSNSDTMLAHVITGGKKRNELKMNNSRTRKRCLTKHEYYRHVCILHRRHIDWFSRRAMLKLRPAVDLATVKYSYTGLGYTGIRTYLTENFSPAEAAHSMFCTVRLFGYTGFLIVYRTLNLSPNQSGIRAIDCNSYQNLERYYSLEDIS